MPCTQDEVPISCCLGVFTPTERAREAELLREHLAATQEVAERDDGYSFRYAADPSILPRIAELIALEHRCCPFLDFQLEWKGANATPWLHVTGGPRVKSFLTEMFVAAEVTPPPGAGG